MNARPSDVIAQVGRELVSGLLAESPLFRSIHDGTVSRDAYAAWLVQQHKYMRWTHELLLGYARGMSAETSSVARAITVGANRHAEEEQGHETNVVNDLAELWSVTPEQALERIEATPAAPAVHLYGAVARTTVAACPAAFAGFAMLMETLASALSPTAKRALLEKRPFAGVEKAVRMFTDHEEDGAHVEGGRFRVDRLEKAGDRIAAVVVARVIKEVYRGIIAHVEAELTREGVALVGTAEVAAGATR